MHLEFIHCRWDGTKSASFPRWVGTWRIDIKRQWTGGKGPKLEQKTRDRQWWSQTTPFWWLKMKISWAPWQQWRPMLCRTSGAGPTPPTLQKKASTLPLSEGATVWRGSRAPPPHPVLRAAEDHPLFLPPVNRMAEILPLPRSHAPADWEPVSFSFPTPRKTRAANSTNVLSER